MKRKCHFIRENKQSLKYLRKNMEIFSASQNPILQHIFRSRPHKIQDTALSISTKNFEIVKWAILCLNAEIFLDV